MPKLRCLNVTSRQRVRAFTQSFIRKEEEGAILAAIKDWTTLTKVRQVKWTADAATKLAEKAIDSFRDPAAEVVGIFVKGIELWTVVFQKSTTVKIVSAVLLNDLDLRARVSAVFGGIR